MAIVWNIEKHKYFDTETGRAVPVSHLRRIVEDVAAALLLVFVARARRVLEALAEIDGDPQKFYDALANWNQELRRDLKAGNLAAGALAFGGFNNMSPEQFDLIEQLIRDQESYFNRFAAAVFSGALALNGIFAARSGMYAHAVYPTFENAMRQAAIENGFTEERNILGNADHCTGEDACTVQSGRGWVPIGTLVKIGDRPCLTNCRCHLIYRKTPDEVIVDES